MAFDDLERQWKEHHREREVKPRETAWDAIEARLGREPRRSWGRAWIWPTAVAAGLVLAIGYFGFLRAPGPLPEGEPVVQNPAPGVPSPDPGTVALQPLQQGGPVPETRSQGPGAPALTPIPPGEGVVPGPEAGHTLAGLEVSQQVSDTALLSERIARQLDTVLTQVASMEQGGRTVTDAEVDSLLRQAQRALAGESPDGAAPGVDPLALLDEAEQELDRSFRDQILEKLRSGFRKVRTAVADRNQ